MRVEDCELRELESLNWIIVPRTIVQFHPIEKYLCRALLNQKPLEYCSDDFVNWRALIPLAIIDVSKYCIIPRFSSNTFCKFVTKLISG